MKSSKTLKEMLRKKKGYRCESYSGSRVRRADVVVDFETFELNNIHVLVDVCKALGGKNCEWDERIVFRALKDELSKYDAIWLTSKSASKLYCGDEEPDEYSIASDMIPTCDLDKDGTLFLVKDRRLR